MTTTTEVTGFLVESFALEAGRSTEPSWLVERREAAMRRYEEIGLPTTRDEEWKYSDVRPIATAGFVPAPRVDIDAAQCPAFGLEDTHRLVLVNGRFSAEHSSLGSLPEGVILTGLAEAIRSRPERMRDRLGSLLGAEVDGFAALNTALFQDGAYLDVPDGVRLEKPVLVLYVDVSGDEPRAYHARNLFTIGDRASARVVVGHVGAESGTFLTNLATETTVGADADLELVRVDLGGPSSWLVENQATRLDRASRAGTTHVSLGGGWARTDLGALIAGEGAECRMSGLALAVGLRHVDFHTTIDHAVPNGRSDELFKNLVGEGSTGVFRGRILVREDAQKTDAYQTNRNLLLSDGAKVWTRPQLEIYADDVKCSHGATIGRLDEEGLFYLRSRGIEAGHARRMLMTAFASEVLDLVSIEGLREDLRERLDRLMPVGDEGGAGK